MRRIIFISIFCLLSTACTVGVVKREDLTPLPSSEPSLPPLSTNTLPSEQVPSFTPNGPSQSSPTPATELTNTPTPLPTPSPTTTDTPVPPPPDTSTPPPTSMVSSGPVIHYFRANTTEADPGDTVVLEWSSKGATDAVLYYLEHDVFPQSGWRVNPTGTFSADIDSGERNFAKFHLYVLDEAKRSANASLAIKLRCPDPWFFSPAPDECPTAVIRSDAAEQHFEHGIMIWIQEPWNQWTIGESWVFVLYDDGQTSPSWQVFSDQWDEGEPDRDPELTPPAGLYQPIRGFGLVWRHYPDVRNRLGWAVDQETGFRTAIQNTTRFKYNATFLRSLDGNVWHLGPEFSRWEKIAVDS